MPNIVFENLKNFSLPFSNGDSEFLAKFDSKFESLILAKTKFGEFFLTLKNKENGYVLKSDKITKPADTSPLHKALIDFSSFVASGVKFSTLKEKDRIKKQGVVAQISDFLQEVRNSKFDKIFIEIGFGSGRHILYQAKSNPNALVIGVEVYPPAILQVANLADQSGLKNLILVNFDARLVLSLLDSNSVDRVFLHFPVPWPKSPKRRVVSEIFIKETRRVLKVGGSFELRSDEPDYVDFTKSFIENLDQKELKISKNQNLEISSKYEDRWKRLNKEIFDLIFVNHMQSPKLDLSGNFDFDRVINDDFSDKTFKFDDFFLHIEQSYKNGDEVLLRVAMGSFYRPEHLYVLIKDFGAKYMIKQPLLTAENLKAHKVLKEYLCKKS